MTHIDQVRACISGLFLKAKAFSESFQVDLPKPQDQWVSFPYLEGQGCYWKRELSIDSNAKVRFRAEEEAAMGPHFHDNVERVTGVEGTVGILVEGRRYIITAGETMEIPKGAIHSVHFLPNSEIEITWYDHDGESLEIQTVGSRRAEPKNVLI